MASWFFFDGDGAKQGPINDHQLKALVQRGTITPDTRIETAHGQQTTAGKIKGLPFPTASPPPDHSSETYGLAGEPADFGFPSIESGGPPVPPPPTADVFTATAPPIQPIPVPKPQTRASRTVKDTLTNFKAKPGLNWLLDLRFRLCYVFTFAKGIIQVFYVICLVLTVLALIFGPLLNSYPVWRSYNLGRKTMADLYKTERELKSQLKEIDKLSEEKLRERIEAEVRKEYAAYRSLLQDELDRWDRRSAEEIRKHLTTELKLKLTIVENEIQDAKRHVPSLMPTLAWTIVVTLATWLGALLQIFFIRLFCEWWIFMLDWFVDTRQASQHIIAGAAGSAENQASLSSTA